ncbi:MAG: hypothetical protein HY747_02310 [Elusimicrobia bacterium]|nr:hypothetical protein [Elusimicrobiota bacterium]
MFSIAQVSELPYNHYNLIVIGAGPAGLGVVNNPDLAGRKVLVVDSGKSVMARDRYNPNDLTCGDGGAGLFSDGKFSFFPSSTALWSLADYASLEAGYEWTAQVLSNCGMAVPPFPDSAPQANEPEGQWFLKRYPSEYLSLEHRIELIRGLVERGHGNILNQAMVEAVEYSAEEEIFDLQISDRIDATARHIKADKVIFAAGRFGPRLISRFPFTTPAFRRLEVGFRIQQPTERAFFQECEQLDPKFKFIDYDGKTEWRTFCACRDGEAVLSNTLGLWTVSGRSDCPPTGKTNIGFNTRIFDEKTAQAGWRHLERTLQKQESHYNLPIMDVLSRRNKAYSVLVEVMGAHLAELMLRGIEQLAGKFPNIYHPTTVLIGPTLEGVGCYPDTDDNLKVPGVPAWVVGDSCGKFRGITASLISGYYAASRLASEESCVPAASFLRSAQMKVGLQPAYA